MWAIFLELNFEGPYQSSVKEKESCYLVFPSSTKCEIRQFQRCRRATTAKICTKKRDARAKIVDLLI